MLRNGQSDNGYPSIPTGMDGASSRDDAGETGGGIVPVDPGESGGGDVAAWKGYLSCALGGVAAGLLPVVSCAAVSYGAFLAIRGRGAKEVILSAVFSIAPALAVSIVLGYAAPLEACVACLAGVAVAGFLAKRAMSTSTGIITVTALSLALMGCDAIVAWLSGTTLPQIAEDLVAAYESSLGDLSVDTAAQVSSMLSMYKSLWPMSYVIMGLAEFCIAWLGVQTATRRLRLPGSTLPHLVDYDAPLWATALLVIGLLGLTAGSVVSSSTELVAQVSLNVVMSLRVIFAIQGLAVLTWFFREKRMGSFASTVFTLLALYLELQFYIMTIVGLVDVWRNFRHLPRGKKVTVQDASNQE